MLYNLHRKKCGRLVRYSSYDRTGQNDDSFMIPAKKRVTLAEINGPGIIRHIWMTSPMTQESLEGLVLRFFWDGSKTPSVEVPLGAFFGAGFGKVSEIVSLPIVVTPGGGLNCYLPMPFKKLARIEAENQGGKPTSLYFHFDTEVKTLVGDDDCYFHALWRGEQCKPSRTMDARPENFDKNDNFHDILVNKDGKNNYKILQTKGAGHYCGCFYHVFSLLPARNNWRCWWGEGDDMIFVDGEAWPPAIHGTGAEDYFNDAYGLHKFTAPFCGCHFLESMEAAGKFSAYRFHVLDAIPFSKDIAVTIEHGHGNERADIVQSTAFFYLKEPGLPERLPAYERRILFNDFQIVPRKVGIPGRKGPYILPFPK